MLVFLSMVIITGCNETDSVAIKAKATQTDTQGPPPFLWSIQEGKITAIRDDEGKSPKQFQTGKTFTVEGKFHTSDAK
jgi:hypothetical protein